MRHKWKELVQELSFITKGPTFDALLPPIVFATANGLLGLNPAVVIALSLGAVSMVRRVRRGQVWYYAVGGFVAVALAATFAFFTRSPLHFYVPEMISGGLLLVGSMVSLYIGRPIAALVSHVARGWPLAWFLRPDVKPAYELVSWVWAMFFLVRLLIMLFLLRQGDAYDLAWASILLGWPFILLLLVFSFVFGRWQLQKLGGPGVQEYLEGKKPPWEGQLRGF